MIVKPVGQSISTGRVVPLFDYERVMFGRGRWLIYLGGFPHGGSKAGEATGATGTATW